MRGLGCALLLVAAFGCAGGCSSDAESEPEPWWDVDWLPVAPNSLDFSWQGIQERLTEDGPQARQCAHAKIALAMWDQAVCYAAHSGELMCAGQIGVTVFGPEFVPAGLQNVQQLLGSPMSDDGNNSAVCALKTDGTAWCLGHGDLFGQFRTADGQSPGGGWKQWGDRSDIAELSTGNMSKICARYRDKTADCAGHLSPNNNGIQMLPETDINRLWVDSQSEVHVNDYQVFRAGNSYVGCVVIAQGLACTEPPEVVIGLEEMGAPMTPYGVLASGSQHAGRVVDGNSANIDHVCWLTASGRVSCAESTPVELPPFPESPITFSQHFVGKRVVALAVNGYSQDPDLCAAMSDGSLWCVGGNFGGKFGSGSTDALTVETQVQPPYSVGIRCPQQL